MNILVLTNQLSTGGAEYFTVRLSNELSRRGHHVTFASEGGELKEVLESPINHLFAPTRKKSPWGIWQLARQLREILISKEIDVVHANSPTTALAARLARGKRHIPVIASAHGFWKPWTRPGVAAIYHLGADRIAVCSRYLTEQLIRNGFPRGKAEIVYNGIPIPSPDPKIRKAIREELGLSPNQRVLVTVARLVPEKGINYLLEAMTSILVEQPRAVLLLVGDGPVRGELEELAQKLGVQDSVRFLGNRQDVARLLCGADLFCLPSLIEGLPLSIAEAMAASLPVVATEVGGVPEIVLEGITGCLASPCNPPHLALKILRLLEWPEKMRQMGEAGRKRALNHFSIEQMTSHFEALYNAGCDCHVGTQAENLSL